MEMTDAQADDASPLEARRAKLRVLHDRILEATEALPMPQSHAEAAHAFRCVASADRALIQIYSRVTGVTSHGSSPRRSRAPTSSNSEPDDFVYIHDDDVEDELYSPPLQGASAAAGEVAREVAPEGADSNSLKAPSISFGAPHRADHGSRELYSRVAHTPAMASGLAREDSADERAHAREKAHTHLESLLAKAERMTGPSIRSIFPP